MERNIEREIKLEVKDPFKLIDNMRRKGAAYLGGVIEKTIRFDTENLDYEKKGKFFRLRSGFSNTLTMKEKINEDKVVRSRIETELEVDDIKKATRILKTLGLSHTRVMEKYRQSWRYKKVKIELDELPFGVYVEIQGEEEDIKKTCEDMNLKIKDKILVTYWEIHEEFSSSKDIKFNKDHEMRLI